MAVSTQPYKGTRDFYPKDMRFRRWMTDKLEAVCERYGYEPYNGPLLESFELYATKTSDEIVNQQLYSFVDRGERKVAIRPEMTPTLARMIAAKINEIPRPIRWYSFGNFWRYERPQRGRLREFYQLNVDVLGGDRRDADLEILQIAIDILRTFQPVNEQSTNIRDRVRVRINHRGIINAYLQDVLNLSAETGTRLMQILDAREKMSPEKFAAALAEHHIESASVEKLDQFLKMNLDDLTKLTEQFDALQIPVQELRSLFSDLERTGFGDVIEFSPSLIRGFDYYTGIVFEVFDQSPENSRALFGGGRYDNLMGLFGKEKLSGVGFGMGDVTLQNFLETHKLVPSLSERFRVFVGPSRPEDRERVQEIATSLRTATTVLTSLSVDSFGSLIKTANKLGSTHIILLGEDESKRGAVMVKNLAEQKQDEVPIAELQTYFKGSMK